MQLSRVYTETSVASPPRGSPRGAGGCSGATATDATPATHELPAFRSSYAATFGHRRKALNEEASFAYSSGVHTREPAATENYFAVRDLFLRERWRFWAFYNGGRFRVPTGDSTRMPSAPDSSLPLANPGPRFVGDAEIDQLLVDEAVHYLNAFLRGKQLGAISGVGDYIVKRFFDGDFAGYYACKAGHASLRLLAGDLRLGMSAGQLSTTVRVADQVPFRTTSTKG